MINITHLPCLNAKTSINLSIHQVDGICEIWEPQLE